jgi:outer membrane protein TolC
MAQIPPAVPVAPTAPEPAWRAANAAVGQFPRGHADLLKWEQEQARVAAPAPAPATPEARPDLTLATAEQAVRQAWRAHRELARPLARLDATQAQQLADGRWLELDPSLNWRIDDFGELLEAAVQARKAWTEAVLGRETLTPLRQALAAAEAAHELGQRMVSVGNWSRLQQAPVQLARTQARMNLHRAQYAAAEAQARLLKTLGLSGLHDAVGLPAQLPALTDDGMSEAEFRRRLGAIQSELPRGNRPRNQADAVLAFEAYQASLALASASQDELLPLRQYISEETVLHYNGMLKSSWDLLTEVQNQAQARTGALAARRDFELARIELQSVLLGGESAGAFSLGAGGGAAPQPAGH